jgi:hypothetical protein
MHRDEHQIESVLYFHYIDTRNSVLPLRSVASGKQGRYECESHVRPRIDAEHGGHGQGHDGRAHDWRPRP